MKESSPLISRKLCDKIHFQAIHSESSDGFSDQSPTLGRGPLAEPRRPRAEVHFVSEEDLEALGAAAPPLPLSGPRELKPPAAGGVPRADKPESPSRRKGAGPGPSRTHCAQVVLLPHPRAQPRKSGSACGLMPDPLVHGWQPGVVLCRAAPAQSQGLPGSACFR